MKTLVSPVSRSARGFSLVEVTIALGVAGFCLLAIFGLLPVALNSNLSAVEQTAANGILSMVSADLRATPPTTPRGAAAESQQYAVSIPASTGASTSPGTQTLWFDGDRKKVDSMALARYRLTIAFTPTPAGGGARSAACATLKVSWPPPVDPATARPSGSVSTFLALDRN